MRMKSLGIFLLLLGFASLSFGQIGGTVRGNVLDKNSGEPILFGTVLLEGTDFGTSTDYEGFFSFGKVPPGNYQLVVSYLGYDSFSLDIVVKNGSNIYERIFLEEGGIDLGVIQVSAAKQNARTEVKASTITVTPKQLRALPTTGGEADIAQYLTILPGVISTGDQGGQLYIRGGSPIQNKILLDGLTIYNAFHSIGLFSVFETETIRNVDVLTGGFNAEYGGRISAIVDINTREGNKKRFGGLVGASPFLGKLLIEGPIKPLRDDGKGSSSFMLTGKKSFIENTSTSLYSYVNDSLGLPYDFTDLYGKVSFGGANGSKLDLFGFNFEDNASFTNVADLSWKTLGAGASFKIVPTTSPFIINGLFGLSDYTVELDESDGAPRSSGINNFKGQLDFTYFGRSSQLNYGIAFNSISTDFVFENLFGNTISQKDFNTELGFFAKYRKKISNLIIEPGLRIQYYASSSTPYLEPRLGLKYNISDRVRMKAAGGIYSQNILSSVNERDIVNLFVGFLAGPEEEVLQPGSTEPTKNRLQTAIHGIVGIEYDVNDRLTVNLEPYYKKFTQLINVNRNKLDAKDPNYASEEGDAYGIDLLVKYNTENIALWGAYSYGFVNRDDGEQVYPTVFDRRHNLNFVASYNTGKKNPLEVSLRWNLGTGFPFTQTQGFYTFYNFEDGLSTNVLTDNPDLGIIYSNERNGGRLPTYHRLDLSVKKTFEISEHFKVEGIAAVTNAYNRNNIFFFDRVDYERVDQLPILPSLGLTIHF